MACFAGLGLQAEALGSTAPVTRIYLAIKGIDGDVTDPGFVGQIEVVSYSGDTTNGEGGELSLTKYVDSSSPELFELATYGDYLKAATLTVVQTVNGAVAGSMRIDLSTVLITSITSVGETESITLSFERSKVTTKHGGIVDTDPVTHLYLAIKDVAGDVTDPGFEGQIAVVSYSWIATSSPGELSLVKYIDSSSLRILSLATSGTVLKAATLREIQTVNGAIDSSMTIDLQDVLITSVATDSETESIALSFQRSKVTP